MNSLILIGRLINKVKYAYLLKAKLCFSSYSTKTSLSNFLVISGILLLFTAKITNTLCLPLPRETKSFLSILAHGSISLHQKIFGRKFFPQKI